MALTFHLESVLKPLPVGADPSGDDDEYSKATGWARPWEALPLALHRVLNNGEPGKASALAIQIYQADRSTRTLMLVGGIGAATYLAMFKHIFAAPIDFSEDYFVWTTLVVWWLTLGLQCLSQLWGRYVRLPESVSLTEVRDREELNLPLLFFNHQPFGLERWDGLLAAGIVTFLQLAYAGSWATVLYACASRMLANDAYEPTYTVVWLAMLFQGLLTALARSVSFSDLRSTLAKPSSPPTASERARVTLVCLYIFLTVNLVLPLGAVTVLYVRV